MKKWILCLAILAALLIPVCALGSDKDQESSQVSPPSQEKIVEPEQAFVAIQQGQQMVPDRKEVWNYLITVWIVSNHHVLTLLR